MDDRQLIERARNGDQQACGDLVRANFANIYRLLFHLTGDVHRAEDLCQETFAAAWKALASFHGASSVRTWLHRIAYRRFVDWARARTRALREELALPEQQDNHQPLDELVMDEDSRSLHEALERTPHAQREVLVLHYLQGLSYREMAEVLDEPAGTIKWRVSEALSNLRKMFSENENDERTRRKNPDRAAGESAAAPDPAGA